MRCQRVNWSRENSKIHIKFMMENRDELTSSTSTLGKQDIKWYRCQYDGCNKAYRKPCRLAEHILSHTNERPYLCPEVNCGKAFNRQTHLSAHLQSHQEERSHVCEHPGCNKTFVLKCHLTRHVKTHLVQKPYQCTWETCSEAFTKHTQLRKHMSEHTNQLPFTCTWPECLRSFLTSSKLKRHIAIHANPKSYVCGITDCSQTYGKWSELQAHIKHTHRTDPVCHQCHKSFSSLSQLREHQRNVHTVTGERTLWSCYWDECEKQSSSKSALALHVKTVHENTKPYRCSYDDCDMEFGHKHVMVRHIRTAHSSTALSNPTLNTSGIDHDLYLEQEHAKSSTLVEVNHAKIITGIEYELNRQFPCMYTPCPYRFMRQYDLDRHIAAEHQSDPSEQSTLTTPNSIGNLRLIATDGNCFVLIPSVSDTPRARKRKRYMKHQRPIREDGVTHASGFVEYSRLDQRTRENSQIERVFTQELSTNTTGVTTFG